MILYDGKHVDGSPFTVRVHDPGQVRVSGVLRTGVVGSTVVFTGEHIHFSLTLLFSSTSTYMCIVQA